MRVFKNAFSQLAILLLLPCSLLFGQSASITAVQIPSAIADAGGTGTVGYPYAVFVRIQNWTSGASSQAYLKLYSSTNNEYMWSGTGVWSNTTTYSNTNQPVVTIDASGNWSGWIYAKHNTNVGATPAVRAAKVGATSTNLTSATHAFTILNMTSAGTGGWIIRTSSPAVNKGILAYSAGVVVGTYRTEDNGITEGYTYGPGGFKIAVPAGFVDSLVTLNDDGSRDQSFIGPWPITAGMETDAGGGGGQIGHGTASITPSMLSGGVSHQLSVVLHGQSPYTLVRARVAVPSQWTWSHSTADVTLVGGGSPAASISGDTVVITNLSLGSTDSLQVNLSNLIPTDSTANFSFFVKTGTAPDSVYAIGTQPSIFIYSTPLPLGVAKQNDTSGVPLLNNRLITVRGVVTVANQFNGPSYIQDNTGGLAIFGSTFSTAVQIGDEVIVSGLVQPFSGLTEIVNPRLIQIVSSGNTVQPLVVTASQIANDGLHGVEAYECLLVRLDNVTATGTGNWAANTNYPLTDPTGSTQIRISTATNLVGTPIPAGAYDLIGVVGQFISTPPYIGGYQILPRFLSDQISSGPIIETLPIESNLHPTSMVINWRTTNNGSTRLRYGTTTSFELGIIGNDSLTTNHTVTLTGLTPSTVYYAKAFSVAGTDTSFASTIVVSSASPVQSTGTINVYFNKSVNNSLVWHTPASGNQDLVARITPRIANARRSIDVALYSLSGNPGLALANLLVSAYNRGVKVRVICENDNRNTSAFNLIAASGIPMITDTFDPINNGAGLMHNKFFVFDGRGGAPESVWVWTGSWNPTDPGTNSDFQNSIEFQDQSISNAYRIQFNQMWGSDTDVPNAANSRFGARKIDNSPHRFVVGGKQVEVYFSPSDGATAKIIGEINKAQSSVGFQLLTLTRSDIANALVAKKTAGKKVRGDLDSDSDTGSQFSFLVSNGVDVRLKTTGISGLLHHKYGIIDAENPFGSPVTITGSHNWTTSAETANNENMVIVRDADVTNQYLQEFAARYSQFGGPDTIRLGVEEAKSTLPLTYALEQNYPNPFNPSTVIRFDIPAFASLQNVTLKVYDILGREVSTLVNEQLKAGSYKVEFRANNLASGVYFYRIETGSFSSTKKLMLLR